MLTNNKPDRGDYYSIRGLLALYEYEPSLRDVYVEGRRDAKFYAWYLGELEITTKVFPIDDRVCIESELVKELGLDVNAKGRAMALAVQCERILGKAQKSVTVIVDADFSHCVGPIPIERSCLLITDDAALENYFLQQRPVDKFLKVYLYSEETAEEILSSIIPMLRHVFSVRSLCKQLNVAVIADITAVCDMSREIVVDTAELLRRCFTNVRSSERIFSESDLRVLANEHLEMVVAANQTGRGHDIAPLLLKRLSLRGKGLSSEAVESGMLACLTADDLHHFPMFQELRKRLTA